MPSSAQQHCARPAHRRRRACNRIILLPSLSVPSVPTVLRLSSSFLCRHRRIAWREPPPRRRAHIVLAEAFSALVENAAGSASVSVRSAQPRRAWFMQPWRGPRSRLRHLGRPRNLVTSLHRPRNLATLLGTSLHPRRNLATSLHAPRNLATLRAQKPLHPPQRALSRASLRP